MWNIVIVSNAGSQTFKYPKIPNSGSYSLTNAIEQALKTTGLKGVSSVTVTII